jgi:hypothetical protein
MNACHAELFDPSRSWKQSFYQTLRDAARTLGIQVHEVHRLPANYTQNLNKKYLEIGKSNEEARMEISRRLGHSSVEVTNIYISKLNTNLGPSYSSPRYVPCVANEPFRDSLRLTSNRPSLPTIFVY